MTRNDPVYVALVTMRGFMTQFIKVSGIDPATTSITFRGPDQLATCCKLQEVLDIADAALAWADAGRLPMLEER